MANKLKIAKVSALPVLSDTTATTNVITVDSTTGLTQGDRFVPASTVGGLTGGTTYFVHEAISQPNHQRNRKTSQQSLKKKKQLNHR